MDEGMITQRRKKHKHILRDDRVTIEKLLRAKVENAEIARIIGCTARTLERELTRGMCEQLGYELKPKCAYFADYAERKHKEKARNKGPYPKLNDAPKLRERIEKAIKEEDCSPYGALEKAREDGLVVEISVKTLYNSIDRGDLDVTRKDLLRKDGWKQEKTAPRQGLHTKGKSIDERPAEANDRSEPGHWEGDLVVGKKGSKPVLLTLTDRKTRKEIIVKFLNFEKLEEAFGCNVFYAHPYSSWERGTNENSNGIIRRFLPKGTDFSRVSNRKVKAIQDWMNNYPRKILNGKTPNAA